MLKPIRRDLKISGYTVGQFPNPPLWTALAALLAASLTSGTVHDLARAVFYVALTAWAYEEARYGVNSFRRGLGVVALVWIVATIAQAIS